MLGLTKRQQEIAGFVRDFIQTYRYSPSCREIMQHFGFSSPGTVARHLSVLKRKGVLTAEKKGHRSLAVTRTAFDAQTPREIELPFIGVMGGGAATIETFPQSRSLAVPAFMVPAPDKTYALRVVGDSWLDERIAEGDLLLVEARKAVRPGETVVVRSMEGEFLIRRYYLEGLYVRLVSHHPHLQAVIVKYEEIQLQGVVVALLRLYD